VSQCVTVARLLRVVSVKAGNLTYQPTPEELRRFLLNLAMCVIFIFQRTDYLGRAFVKLVVVLCLILYLILMVGKRKANIAALS
jgi:hypothetical protein